MGRCSCKATDKPLQPSGPRFSMAAKRRPSWEASRAPSVSNTLHSGRPATVWDTDLGQPCHGDKALGASGNGPRKGLFPA